MIKVKRVTNNIYSASINFDIVKQLGRGKRTWLVMMGRFVVAEGNSPEDAIKKISGNFTKEKNIRIKL